MFFTRENEILYLTNWEYNACLVMTELAKIVIDNGGRVKPEQIGKIVNRGVNKDPVAVTNTTYISFVLDDVHYYYQVDDNPFFPFYYCKTPVINNTLYSMDACLDETNKDWALDALLRDTCTHKDHVRAANALFTMIKSSEMSEKRIDHKRVRVQNMYDGGFHYENVPAKERFATIDY